MKFGFSEAYRLFKEISEEKSIPLNLEDLDNRILQADQDLIEEIEMFKKRVLQASDCLKKNDRTNLIENLAYMRFHAVGIGSEFDNLVAVLDEVARSS